MTQRYGLKKGVDFIGSFSSTPRLSTTRLVFALAANKKLYLYHADIETAYLYGDMEGDVYMEQPEGFTDRENSELVCKLLQGLYGHPAAGRQWAQKFSSILSNFGLAHCPSDTDCYIRRFPDGGVIIVVIYVDDVIIAADSENRKAQFIDYLRQHFNVKDLGLLHWFLGIRVQRVGWDVVIDQSQYALDVLERYGMSNCNPVKTPGVPGAVLSDADCPKTDKKKAEMKAYPFRQSIGSLLWLARGTRLDIIERVNSISQFLQNPGPSHWRAMKPIFRYLRGTVNMCLTYSSGLSLSVIACVDSNWGSHTSDPRSRAAFIF